MRLHKADIASKPAIGLEIIFPFILAVGSDQFDATLIEEPIKILNTPPEPKSTILMSEYLRIIHAHLERDIFHSGFCIHREQ